MPLYEHQDYIIDKLIQYTKHYIGNPLTTDEESVLKMGFCFGLAFTYGSMAAAGKKTFKDWKNSLQSVLMWDGNIDKLANDPKLSTSFETVFNYILWYHAYEDRLITQESRTLIKEIEHENKNIHYYNQHGILKERNPFFTSILGMVKYSKTIAGHFNTDMLKTLLSKEPAIFSKNAIFLIEKLGHTCSFWYTNEDKKWYFYNPNNLTGEQKFSDITDFIHVMLKDLGNDIDLRIITTDPNKDNQKAFDRFIDDYKSLFKKHATKITEANGLVIIAKKTPDFLPMLQDAAKTNFDVWLNIMNAPLSYSKCIQLGLDKNKLTDYHQNKKKYKGYYFYNCNQQQHTKTVYFLHPPSLEEFKKTVAHQLNVPTNNINILANDTINWDARWNTRNSPIFHIHDEALRMKFYYKSKNCGCTQANCNEPFDDLKKKFSTIFKRWPDELPQMYNLYFINESKNFYLIQKENWQKEVTNAIKKKYCLSVYIQPKKLKLQINYQGKKVFTTCPYTITRNTLKKKITEELKKHNVELKKFDMSLNKSFYKLEKQNDNFWSRILLNNAKGKHGIIEIYIRQDKSDNKTNHCSEQKQQKDSPYSASLKKLSIFKTKTASQNTPSRTTTKQKGLQGI